MSKRLIILCLSVLVAMAAPTFAQTGINGEIQGRVVDSSGGALPGVAVTLSGVSMMGTQTAVTGDNGSYRFPALAAGDYRLQFELPGFATLVRSGIGVNVRTTTSLNVSLEIASLAETVTVSGESSVVDTANARGGISLTSELLNEIPSSRDSYGLIAMASGAVRSSPSVGGSTADLTQSVSVNGTTASRYNVNGAETRAGAGNGRYGNYDAYEEIVVETGGASADARRPGGGFSADLIARTGGNQFHGMANAYWYNDKFVGGNLNDRLRASGLEESGDIKSLRDIVAQVGGPFWRDHIWFFVSEREYFVVREVLGADHLQRGRLQPTVSNVSFQTNSHNKFQLFYSKEPKKDTERALDRFILYLASGNQQAWSLTRQIKYLSTIGQNMVLEAQAFKYTYWWPTYPQVGSGAPFQDTATGIFYNGQNEGYLERLPRRQQVSGAVSRYIPGWLRASHDVKVGGDWATWRNRDLARVGRGPDMEVRYQVANGVPTFATIDNGPYEPIRHETAYSLYAQDRITAGRITMNIGARYDAYRGWIPAQQSFGAGQPPDGVRWAAFFPYQSLPEISNALTWKNVSPRLNAIYQLTGDGKTLIKSSFGLFLTEMAPEDTDFVNGNVLQTNRYRWLGDLNGNNLLDPASELGALVSTVRARDNRFAPGFKNPNVREVGVSFERQLPLNLSFRTNYYYTQYYDQQVTTNIAIPANAFTPVPYLDPGPDGKEGTADDKNITVYNRAPGLTGSVSVRSNYSEVSKRAHTFGVTIQKRLANGWQVLSTYNFNRIPENSIGDLNDPNVGINSEGRSTLESPHTLKFAGSYLLRQGSVQLSASWSIQQGQPYNRTLSVRGLNQGTFSITADPTGTWRYDTQNQLDVRGEKQFRLRGGKLIGLQVEGYNMLNNSATTILGSAGVGSVTGGNFGQISHVVPPRTFRLGTRFTF